MNGYSKRVVEVSNIMPYTIKFILAHLLAMVMSSFLLLLYVGPYRHFLPADNVTTSHLAPNFFYYQFVEGGFIGKFDKSGYNNTTTQQHNNTTTQQHNNVDILLLGSSQFESLQVFPNKNLCALLNANLAKDNVPRITYNLGISGNFFPFVVGHYQSALQKYHPRQYAVVEFAPDHIDPTEVKKALDGSLLEGDVRYEPSFIKRLVVKARLVDHLRITLKKRIISVKNQVESIEEINSDNLIPNDELYSDLQKCFQILAESSDKYKVQCLLLFRPRLEIAPNGSLYSTSSPEYVQRLKTLSENEGLVFIDMTSQMIAEYNKKHILPYGFWNTFPNTGHCNKEGHRMMAEAIYDKIMELENSKEEETK